MVTPIAKRTRAAPSPLKGTSPAADRGLAEQADILDRVLPDDDDTVDEDVPPESSDEDEDDVPPPPDETEEAEEGAPVPAPAPARGGRRPPTDYYGEDVVVHTIDATSEKDPAVVAKLEEIFSVDAAGYTSKGEFARSGNRLIKVIKCRRANYKPSCPKAVHLDIVEEKGGKKFVEIRENKHPHDHAPLKVQLTQHRGLHPQMKHILQPFIKAKRFKMTRALRALRDAGWLGNWDTKEIAEKITQQVKEYCKRERRKLRVGFWKGSYGEFASVVASRLVDAEKIVEMVEAREYDRFVVLMSDISGDKKTTFYVGATIRSLSYAPVQELGRGFAWATTDGTGRCNYNGKIVIFVGTVCGQGRVRLIGSMLLSKGETTNEIAQGLKCLADAIRVVHKTFLRMLTTVPFRDGLYDATALGSDYKWRPLITMNDNSDAIFHAWAEVIAHAIADSSSSSSSSSEEESD